MEYCLGDADGSATFAPVATALRAAAGIDESAEPAAVMAAIKGLVPEDRDRARIAERASALLGVGGYSSSAFHLSDPRGTPIHSPHSSDPSQCPSKPQCR